MITKEKVIDFFKPDRWKIGTTLVIVFLILYGAMKLPYGHVFSPVPYWLYVPVDYLFHIFLYFGLVLFLIYSYLIACLVVFIGRLIRKRKWLLISVLVLIFFTLGLDEPIVNNTVNYPDYSCTQDSDCTTTSTTKGWCGNYQCVNNDWQYYDSAINSVFALSCSSGPVVCSCANNRCEAKDMSQSTDYADCERSIPINKNYCMQIVASNIERINQAS